MRRTPLFSAVSFALAAIFVLPGTVSGQTVVIYGQAGAYGADAVTPGGHGGNGGPGQPANGVVNSGTDIYVTGGQGGAGGNGANGTSAIPPGAAGAGGNGGAASLTATAGNQMTVRGGDGGGAGVPGSFGAATGAWSSAGHGGAATSNVTQNVGRRVFVLNGARGGDGGSGRPGGTGGNGGNASSDTLVMGTGANSIDVRSGASGGNGGNGLRAGIGGTATARARGVSELGAVAVSTSQVAGDPGLTLGPQGLAGLDASASNTATGATAGPLGLSQSVTAGRGGDGAVIGGRGGSARSVMDMRDTMASDFRVTSDARAGRGGNFNKGAGAPGGDALSIARASSPTAGNVNATSSALTLQTPTTNINAGTATATAVAHGLASSNASASAGSGRIGLADAWATGGTNVSANSSMGVDGFVDGANGRAQALAVQSGTAVNAYSSAYSMLHGRGDAVAEARGTGSATIFSSAQIVGTGTATATSQAGTNGVVAVRSSTSMNGAGDYYHGDEVSTTIPIYPGVMYVPITDTQQGVAGIATAHAVLQEGYYPLDGTTVREQFTGLDLVGGGSFGANLTLGPEMRTASNATEFDFTTLSASHLKLGVFSRETAFTLSAFDLSVLDHGTELLALHFDSAEAALAALADQAFDLGLLSAGDHALELRMNGTGEPSLFVTLGYLFGVDAGVLAVPEPGAPALWLAGLLVVFHRRFTGLRRNRRT